MVPYPSNWWHRWQALVGKVKREIYSVVIAAPLEPLLHPSARRLYWLGFFAILAHTTFGLIWVEWLPQPYENLWFRGLMVALGMLLFFIGSRLDLRNRVVLTVLGLLFWLELPYFTGYMYFSNGRNAMWLATLVGAILIYHTITDWRIASLGTGLGLIVSYQWVNVLHVNPIQATSDWQVDAWVILFGWSVGAMLGISSASRQRVQLSQTLTSIGIMAHELRTPLSSIGLVATHLEHLTERINDPHLKQFIVEQTKKIDRLSVQMNRQIDTQIANAKLERLTVEFEPMRAFDLITSCMNNYPFKSKKEAHCWEVEVKSDFEFDGPRELMEQVVFNLVKNSLLALKMAGSNFTPQSILFRISADKKLGHIEIIDKGVGMSSAVQRTIFEPMFSTQQSGAHGLGLAFCKKVITTCKGKITVTSQLGKGAAFRISLPLYKARDNPPSEY